MAKKIKTGSAAGMPMTRWELSFIRAGVFRFAKIRIIE